MDVIRAEVGAGRFETGFYERARDLFDGMIRADSMIPFLTNPAYQEL